MHIDNGAHPHYNELNSKSMKPMIESSKPGSELKRELPLVEVQHDRPD